MATTTTATPGKTSFVKEFLHDNPQGNTKAVNEAWQAAGFEGTISPTLVNKTRVKLTGKRVKRLTRLLNRCYARHQLVWKEG